MRGDVAVTGMGAVSALGEGCAALLDAFESGRGGIDRIRRFDTSGFSVHLAAEVGAWFEGPPVTIDPDEDARCVALALSAAREAMAEARLDPVALPSHRVGMVFGTSLGSLTRPVHELAEWMARELRIDGPLMTVCTACSSSTGAIGLARDLVTSGTVDFVLAGGADVLTERVFAGFHALGVLSPERCAPFSMPFGTSLGEGAGFLVLEDAEWARRRGVTRLAFLSGYGLSADAFHETSPDPRGRGVEMAVRAALVDADIGAGDVGYVNAHGSGTEANDRSEWQGIRRALDGLGTVPVSSSKGALGHTQGAAGALETVVTILAMRRGLMPPTLNFSGPRPYAPEDPIAGPEPRSAGYEHAICVNAAFGGANAALVVSRSPRSKGPAPRRRPVVVAGVGLVSDRGLGIAAWEAGGRRGSAGPVPPFSLAEVDPRIDPHGLDASSLYLTAAAALALSDPEGARPLGPRKLGGLVLGSVRASPQSTDAFAKSIENGGLSRVSTAAFARIVLNAPAGFCSKLLGLRGPLTALTVGTGSGLAALLVAAEQLSLREDVPFILGGAVDELDTGAESEEGSGGEGAACVVLASGPEAAPAGPRLTGWGAAGRGRVSEAIDRAVAASGGCGPEADGRFDERDYASLAGVPRAVPSSLAFVAALSALRRGEVRRALVTSDMGDSVSLAVLVDA